MSEAAAGEGQFSTLAIEFRKFKVRELLAVIKKHNPDGIFSFLTSAEWIKFASRLPHPLNRQPYASLFFVLIDTMVTWQKQTRNFPQEGPIGL